MNAEKLQARAVDQYLRTVQAPIRMIARLIGSEDSQRGRLLLIDRVDATVRRSVGRLLNNDELQADAGSRRVATEQREMAVELRSVAEKKNAEADMQFSNAQQAADRKRVEAKERAENAEAQIEQAASEHKLELARLERERKAIVADAKAKADKAIATKEKKDRLDQLNLEAESLAERESALETVEEADRLKESAAKVKAARKS